jgi:hypothetical protein
MLGTCANLALELERLTLILACALLMPLSTGEAGLRAATAQFPDALFARSERAMGPAVYLSIDQDGGLSARQLKQAIDQASEIWRAAGVGLTAGRYGEASAPGAATISLRITQTSPRRKTEGPPVLAWVGRPIDGRLKPVLCVSRPGIDGLLDGADFLGHPLRQGPGAARQRLVAQAIGRVVAHELGHFLLQSASHTSTGLMRADYSPRDLLGASLEPFRVTAEQLPSVQREVVRLAELQAAWP